MSSKSTNNNPSSSSLVLKLVSHLLQKPPDSVKSEYRLALQSLNGSVLNYESNELSVCDKINKKFILEGRSKDALTFDELYRKLRTSLVLKNRVSVLHCLCCLYGSEKDKLLSEKLANNLSKKDSFDAELVLNSHDVIKKYNNKSVFGTGAFGDFFKKNLGKEINSDRHATKHSKKSSSGKALSEPMQSKMAYILSKNSDKHNFSQLNSKHDLVLEKALSARSEDSNLGSLYNISPNIQSLLRSLLFVLQGIKSDVIHWETERKNLEVEFKEELPNPVKKLALRFIEIGWMYCRINRYCCQKSSEKSHGLIVQSFVAALKSRLVEYYKLISELEALLLQETSLSHLHNASNVLTLHQLLVWTFEPHTQLKVLAALVDACEGKKGGALTSALYSHLQHGNNFVQSLVQNLLRDVTRPLFKMLSSWIYCGELEDYFGEFFVAAKITSPDCDLWQDKYSLNEEMIPSFIMQEQAKKILSTGKGINFLHHICQDSTYTRDDDKRIKALEILSTETLFCQDKDANFENILEKNYTRTSKRVLQVLYDKYNLMNHLLAMRNYFLMAQGDFIQHLMDLLNDDLSKPARSLYIHNLTGILDSAIRATNAQYHHPEVLQRLDVKVLEVSFGDTGWDVFNLVYHVTGPIKTVLSPDCLTAYCQLFSTLWKAKRMEYILNKISHSRTTYLKLQSRVPEVTPVLYQCHFILAQMVHFVQQMQYYMAFEVMECSWADLLAKISSAKDLDEVIQGHESFLNTLLIRALLDESSVAIKTQLKAIYDLILQFDRVQEKFWSDVQVAVDNVDKMKESIESKTNKDGWGITSRQQKEYLEPLNQLKSNKIAVTKANLRVISRTYEEIVQQFLVMISDQNLKQHEQNLHFLSFRLDFNEFYKKRNYHLHTSFTYQHRRKSINVHK